MNELVANDMDAVASTSKWDVTHIPEEEQIASTTGILLFSSRFSYLDSLIM